MFSKKATKFDKIFTVNLMLCSKCSAIDSEGAPQEFGGSEKGRSLIFAYRSLAITTNTPGFKKLSTALSRHNRKFETSFRPLSLKIWSQEVAEVAKV